MTVSAMSFNNKQQLLQEIKTALIQFAPEHQDISFVLERAKNPAHGDYACNLAMQLARPLKQNPRQIAEAFMAALPPSEIVSHIDIAGAGFINFTLTSQARQQIVTDIWTKGESFGQTNFGQQASIHVEFVSANPTGPLHVGHGRGAAYGASLSNILSYAGFEVTREYYVNDAGRQMDILALSTWLRYLECCGETLTFPQGAYQGEYVRTMGDALFEKYQQRFFKKSTDIMHDIEFKEDNQDLVLDMLIDRAKTLLDQDYRLIHQFALNTQLSDCKEDLSAFGVEFDCWFSEQSLYDTQEVEQVITDLTTAGYIYEKNGAKWFRSTDFNDEKDRVVQRENGLYTYFASDIAYIKNKFSRGFQRLIYVCGADHHGYIPRILGAAEALSYDPQQIDFPLVQFAILYREGEKVSMSTRAGEFVTLRELRQEVGNDAARFFYIVRKSDQHLDFDLDLAKSENNDNPVYYIQYAHARICRILEDAPPTLLAPSDLSLLTLAHEDQLLRKLSDFPELINVAAQEYAPHVLAFYLKELAADFHSYYNVARILVEDSALATARLSLISAIRQVFSNGLTLLGVKAPHKM